MQPAGGELIRQIRRQYNLTQTELGGDRFSKSYVSAVERNKIVPSPQALQYFSEQLGKPRDYFANIFQQPESMKQLAMLAPVTLENGERRVTGHEELTILDILLGDTDVNSVVGRQQLRTLPPQVVAALPPARQARYHFLLGREAQADGDLPEALQAFERALALAPVEMQVPVLNELGQNYALAHNYQTALAYHLRAHQLWNQLKERPGDTANTQGFQAEFNCGKDYQVLGMYREACEHYEQARRYLSTEHDMKTAAALYYGLGYCVYGAIDQTLNAPDGSDVTVEKVEHEYQRASSFLMQSRTLSQVGGDRSGEAQARLLQARVLLDFCERRRRLSRKAEKQKSFLLTNCSALLTEAEEQCRQALFIGVEEAEQATPAAPRLVDTIIYSACAYLVRVFVQHAAIARQSGYRDTALRELMGATYVCNELINSLARTELPLELARRIGVLNLHVVQQGASTTALTKTLEENVDKQHSPLSIVEICLAAAETAGELGHSAGKEKQTAEWYECADRWLESGLARVRAVVQCGEYDCGYLARSYQRGLALLDERIAVDPEAAEQTTRTQMHLLKKAVRELARPIIYADVSY